MTGEDVLPRVLAISALVLVAGCGRLGFSDLRAGDAAITSDVPGRDSTAPIDTSSGATLVAHAIRNGHVDQLTTAAIDTTGASLILVAECTWATGAPKPPLDSGGNTWVGVGPYGMDLAPANLSLFYALSPMTRAQHTFTNPGNDYLSIAVLAFSGFGQVAGATGTTGMVPLSVGGFSGLPVGSLLATFACSGESVATAISIDNGFQLVDYVLNGAAGAPEDMASAFAIASGGTIAPKWTFTGDGKAVGAIAAFR